MATRLVPIHLNDPGSNGNAFASAVDFNPNRQLVYAFILDVDGSWFGRVRIPDDFSANAKVVVTLLANATTGVSRLTLNSAKAADAATFDPASLTAETAQDVTVPATAYLRKDVTMPASGNIATAVAAADDLFVRIDHNGVHANDTLAVNTLMVGAWLQYDTA